MTNQNMTNQKGFTLIELMIVVAIIGILASVAIPQYSVYIGRSEFGSAVSACNELKAAVGEYVGTKGALPSVVDLYTYRPDLMDTQASDFANKYTIGCTVADGGAITTTTVATGITAAIAGQDIILNPVSVADTGGTVRITSWEALTAIESKYIPEALRPAI